MLCHLWLFRLTLRNYISPGVDFSMALRAFALLSRLLPFWTLALDMPAENSWYLGQKSNNSTTQTYPRLCVCVLKRFTQLRSSLDMHMRTSIYVCKSTCDMRCMSDDSLQKSINLVKHEPLAGATLCKKEVKTTCRSSQEFALFKYACCGSPFNAFARKLRQNSH